MRLRLLVASDLHGSNACLRKLVALALQVKPDVVAIAGDFSGKRGYAIGETPAPWMYHDGREWTLGDSSLAATKKSWGDKGYYWATVDHRRPFTAYDLDELLMESRTSRLRNWLSFIDSEFEKHGIACFVIPGNDDTPEIVEVLESARWTRCVDEKVEEYKGVFFSGLGYSNFTPWRTARELDEEQIESRLTLISAKVPDWRRSVFLAHVPPFRSGLDSVPALWEKGNGEFGVLPGRYVDVGSTAIRRHLERNGPLLLLCGHCHDSNGVAQIGSTVCVNPGSSYHTATLAATLVVIEDGRVKGHQPFLR